MSGELRQPEGAEGKTIIQGIKMINELPAGPWLRRDDALKQLNCSKATLNRRKEKGYFQLGTHFIRVGPTTRSPLLWNVEECRKVFAQFEAPKGDAK